MSEDNEKKSKGYEEPPELSEKDEELLDEVWASLNLVEEDGENIGQ